VTTAPPRPGSPAIATTALVLAIVIVVLGVARTAFAVFAPALGVGLGEFGTVFFVLGTTELVLGAGALALGIVAALQPGRGKVLAGVGIGVGGVALIGAAVGFVLPALASAL